MEKILERNPVPVIPMALKGLWGSFSATKADMLSQNDRLVFWSKVDVVIGEVLSPAPLNRHQLQQQVQDLLG